MVRDKAARLPILHTAYLSRSQGNLLHTHSCIYLYSGLGLEADIQARALRAPI